MLPNFRLTDVQDQEIFLNLNSSDSNQTDFHQTLPFLIHYDITDEMIEVTDIWAGDICISSLLNETTLNQTAEKIEQSLKQTDQENRLAAFTE